MRELKPCPFCGKEITILIADGEGNLRDEDYKKDPWSGLKFALHHREFSNIDTPACPIECHEDEFLGMWLYDSKQDAIDAWNRRAEQ